jgi:predicted ATPase/class 3 adenylate cyclase
VIAAPTGTVTFLFSDIEGSTALLQSLGRQRYADVIAAHYQLLRSAWSAHGGYEVDTAGDGFFVAFASAADALAAAQDAQGAVRTADWPHEARVQVRIGIHSGDAVLRDGHYVGVSVHHAARICSAGHGGQIVVSQATAELCRDDLAPGTLRSLGTHRLKDFHDAQQLFQLGEGTFPALRTLVTGNLPRPAHELVGRADELQRVRELILDEGRRLVTVTGAGGTGKTRFAVEAAHALAGHFPDGAFFVPLAPVAGAEWVPNAIAEALRLLDQAGRDLTEVVAEFLASKRMLLVVDNLEHVLDAAAFLAAVVERAPAVVLLGTSREPLRVEHECEYPLDPLDEEKAVELFAARARESLPTFDVEPVRTAVAAICARVDCLPLALELAAARLKLLGVDGLLGALSRSLDVLSGSRRDVPERQRTLRGTIEWSYGLLEPEEQRVCTELAVFAGGCTLEAAETVCAATLDVLGSLLDKHLLRRREDEGEIRFWQLQTIREFGLERLADTVRTRHLDYYATLAERSYPELWRHDQLLWLKRLDRERENVRAALEYGLGAEGRIEATGRLAGNLQDYWDIRGLYREADEWLSAVRMHADELSPDTAARVALGLAIIAGREGKGLWATDLLVEAAYTFRALASPAMEARAAQLAAVWLAGAGDHEEAARMVALVQEAVRDAGDDLSLYFEQTALGEVAAHLNPLTAREHGLTALDLIRKVGDRRNESIVLFNLAAHSADLGDVASAERFASASMELAELFEDRLVLQHASGWLAALHVAEGNLDEAATRARSVLAACRENGAYASGIAALVSAAVVTAERGSAETALELLSAFERLARATTEEPVARFTPLVERTRAAAAGLDPASVARAEQRGRVLTADEAFRLAESVLAG